MHARDITSEAPALDSIPIVSEFSNVFLDDLSDVPPKRKIDFDTDLLLDTKFISILLYRIAQWNLRS